MITLVKATLSDCEEIHDIRFDAFSPLLEKYKDYDTNPAARTLEHIINNMRNDIFDFYFIKSDNKNIGYFRIKKVSDTKCYLSQIAILREYQGRGYAQEAIRQIESLYSNVKEWELTTIKQEDKLRYLYEKMGYKFTGRKENINEKMDTVGYEKYIGI